MKARQVSLDGEEIIPGVIKAVVTFVEPDVTGELGATVEVVLHIQTRRRSFQELGDEAVRQAEKVLREILESE